VEHRYALLKRGAPPARTALVPGAYFSITRRYSVPSRRGIKKVGKRSRGYKPWDRMRSYVALVSARLLPMPGRVPLACGSIGLGKSSTIPLLHHRCEEGVGHGLRPLFLPVGADRPGVAVLDAPWGVAKRPSHGDGEGSETAASERVERAPQWVCVAMAPERMLRLVLDGGNRTLAMAQRLVHQGAQVCAPDGAPLWLTEGWRASLTALRTHSGHGGQPPRRQDQGPCPHPRWIPLPGRFYAPVVKTRRRRLVAGTHRMVCGTLEAVHQRLAPLGGPRNTAFVERLHLTIRQHVAAVGRRVSTLFQGEDGLRQQFALFQTYHNWCLPHARWRPPSLQPVPTKGTGSANAWRPGTPAMAAGLTAHGWTLREGLLCHGPRWPQP
jgi:hypothetical protein